MTDDKLSAIAMLGFFCLMVSVVVYYQEARERSPKLDSSGPRYYSQTPFLNLISIWVMIVPLSLIFGGWDKTVNTLIPWIFGLFVQITVYYTILLLLMPLLRKYFSARSCAYLWMIPGWLYLSSYQRFPLNKPLLLVQPSPELFPILVWVWLAGALAVAGWYTLGHLRYRRLILAYARPVEDPEVLKVWSSELTLAKTYRDYPLVYSPAVSTPLSIGLFESTLRLVLPEKAYTGEELRLIFRHELVHIVRVDNWMKVYLMICCAVCWFNPLMWLARKRCSEDLELSCDEAVLVQEDESARRSYADLILRTAGDGRGFTTCLAASAGALRYRLGSIVRAKRVWNGGLLVGLCLLPLLFTSGLFTMTLEQATVGEVLFPTGDFGDYTMSSIYYYAPSDNQVVTEDRTYVSPYSNFQQEPLMEYLSGLECARISKHYSYLRRGSGLSFRMESTEGNALIYLTDDVIQVLQNYGENRDRQRLYYMNSDVDWETIFGMFP